MSDSIVAWLAAMKKTGAIFCHLNFSFNVDNYIEAVLKTLAAGTRG